MRKSWGRGRAGLSACVTCGVMTPRFSAQASCRCCAADEDPLHKDLGADSLGSSHLMPPAPAWPRGIGKYPRLETRYPNNMGPPAVLWWMPRGASWVPQHPLEYPRNRLKGMTSPEKA